MADLSNVGARLLGARRTVRGNKDALENIIGHAIHDGAQCYVIEAQANYRFLAQSELRADGELVVAPVGNRGRWVRESGLVGMALLEAGATTARDEQMVVGFSNYTHSKLVQFEWDEGPSVGPDKVTVVYTGTVPRLALLLGSAQLLFDRGSAELFIRLDNHGRALTSASLAFAGHVACSGAAQLMPGDKLSLCMRVSAPPVTGAGSLRVVLA